MVKRETYGSPFDAPPTGLPMRFLRWTGRWASLNAGSIILGFAGGALLIGTVYFWTHDAVGHGFWDSLYRATQLFALGFPSEIKNPGFWINLARFLAAFALFGTVLRLVAGGAYNHAVLRFQSRGRSRRHRVVLIGFGDVNQAIARRCRAASDDVTFTVVAEELSPSQKDLIRRLGAAHLLGDAASVETLKQANATKAARIMVATGQDSRNLAIGRILRSMQEEDLAKAEALDRTLTPIAVRPKAFDTLWRFPDDRGSDGANGSRSRVFHKAGIHVHLQSMALLRKVPEYGDIVGERSGDQRFDATRRGMARQLMARGRFVERAIDLGQDRVHLVVAGCGDTALAIVEEAIQLCQSGRLIGDSEADPRTPMLTTIIDKSDSEAVKARIEAAHPAFADLSPEIKPFEFAYHQFDVAAMDFSDVANDTRSREILAEIDEAEPTAWVFCCGPDEVNLKAGQHLRLAMAQERCRRASIHIRLWDAALGPMEDGHGPLGGLYHFGHLDDAVSHMDILADDPDDLGRMIHDFYVANQDKTGASDGPDAQLRFRATWENTPENARSSNRQAARHLSIKIADLGYQWRGMHETTLPRIDRETAREWVERIDQVKGANGLEPEDRLSQDPKRRLLYRIARAEHDRWMADRALEGWRFHSERDNRKRLHPNMVGFDTLETDTRLNDLDALKMWLGEIVANRIPRGAPQAFPRLKHVLDCSGSGGSVPPEPSVSLCVTELELSIIPNSVGETDELAGADAVVNARAILRNAVLGWAGEPWACRLHIKSKDPLDPVSVNDRNHPDNALFEWLKSLIAELAKVAPDVTVDVTVRSSSPSGPQDANGGDPDERRDLPEA